MPRRVPIRRRHGIAGPAAVHRNAAVGQDGASVLHLAGEVIRQAGSLHPADGVLRRVLGGARELSPATARDVSRAVFAFYRWKGWLESAGDLENRIGRALEMADRFARDPRFPPAAELRARAVPAWLGDEVSITDEWLRFLQREAKPWLRARPGQGDRLATALGDCKVAGEGVLRDTLEYSGTIDLFRTKEFHAGEFELQDIGSQAVGLICSPAPGETWWDACAGEGGKTLHLSHLMQNKGLIWASDRVDWRLRKLKRRAARADVFNYRMTLWDGGPKLPTKTKFDGVLIDAPCSGIGTWQRNPHARWTTTLADVKELGALQVRLLTNASAGVRPGGRLVYAVCTLARAETTVVADAFERQFRGFEPLPVGNPLGPRAPKSGRVWLRPEETGGNGMFVAVWQKRP